VEQEECVLAKEDPSIVFVLVVVYHLVVA